MIFDDGGEASMLLQKGVEFEKVGKVPEALDGHPYEWQVLLETLKKSLAESASKWTALSKELIGVSEETTPVGHWPF